MSTRDVAIEIALGSGRCSRCSQLITAGSRYIRAGDRIFYHVECTQPDASMKTQTKPAPIESSVLGHSPTAAAAAPTGPQSPDRQRDVRIDGRRVYLDGELVIDSTPIPYAEANVALARLTTQRIRMSRFRTPQEQQDAARLAFRQTLKEHPALAEAWDKGASR